MNISLPCPPLLSQASALYLDFDGTLAGLAMRPDLVVVPGQLHALLGALRTQLDGAVAIITGRRLADVDALLAPVVLPGAGMHGAELRLGTGDTPQVMMVPGLAPLVDELQRRFAADERLLVEDKGAAVALHYRAAPERGRECVQTLHELAPAYGLDVILGSMVVEARPQGASKGIALRTLAANQPFSSRIPVFVGDDVTDEDAFVAAAALGGIGVKVGNGNTAAQFRCDSVGEVYGWLQESLDAIRRELKSCQAR